MRQAAFGVWVGERASSHGAGCGRWSLPNTARLQGGELLEWRAQQPQRMGAGAVQNEDEARQKHAPLQRWASLDHKQVIFDDYYENRALTEENYKSWPDLKCPAVRSKRHLYYACSDEFQATLLLYQTSPPLAHV